MDQYEYNPITGEMDIVGGGSGVDPTAVPIAPGSNDYVLKFN